MASYRHPTENRLFYSPDREPTTDLSAKIWHILGLNNYSIPDPMTVNKNDYPATHGIRSATTISNATSGSGPSASFLGSDMRAAYYGETALTGSGQKLGIFFFVGTN